jgi:hypothetical protein
MEFYAVYIRGYITNAVEKILFPSSGLNLVHAVFPEKVIPDVYFRTVFQLHKLYIISETERC